jgi:4-hydroxybenzoate polyprenyltransferase
MAVRKLVERVVSSLENPGIPFGYVILTFFFSITLRNFLEIFSDRAQTSFVMFSHFYLSYICLALALILLFHIATGEKIVKISRVILPSFFVLILAPILDMVLSGGAGYDISYLIPEQHPDILLRFLTFFGALNYAGITPGMKIEIFIAIVASFAYFLIKTGRAIKSLAFAFLTYSLIFAYCAMPFALKGFMNFFGITQVVYSNASMMNFYFLLILVLGAIICYAISKQRFISVLKDSRPTRLLHFELMFVLGLVLSNTDLSQLLVEQDSLLHLMLIPISILFVWLFSVIINNIEDFEIDKVSNKRRPLVAGVFSSDAYKKTAYLLLSIALVLSWSVDFLIMFLILVFAGNYYLYSAPPLRLKRVTFFSKIVVSLNSLLLVMLGYSFAQKNLLDFPPAAALFFLVFVTAAANFIDIKDYAGDKKAGVKTLPVVLGLKKSKFVCGIAFLLAYLAAPMFFQRPDLLLLAAILGIIQFWVVNRKKYDERPVFLIYLFSLGLLLVYA